MSPGIQTARAELPGLPWPLSNRHYEVYYTLRGAKRSTVTMWLQRFVEDGLLQRLAEGVYGLSQETYPPEDIRRASGSKIAQLRREYRTLPWPVTVDELSVRYGVTAYTVQAYLRRVTGTGTREIAPGVYGLSGVTYGPDAVQHARDRLEKLLHPTLTPPPFS